MFLTLIVDSSAWLSIWVLIGHSSNEAKRAEKSRNSGFSASSRALRFFDEIDSRTFSMLLPLSQSRKPQRLPKSTTFWRWIERNVFSGYSSSLLSVSGSIVIPHNVQVGSESWRINPAMANWRRVSIGKSPQLNSLNRTMTRKILDFSYRKSFTVQTISIGEVPKRECDRSGEILDSFFTISFDLRKRPTGHTKRNRFNLKTFRKNENSEISGFFFSSHWNKKKQQNENIFVFSNRRNFFVFSSI